MTVDREGLTGRVLGLGAYAAGLIPVAEVPFERSFLSLCESNACGRYGRSWMCPPAVGKIDELIAQAAAYQWMLVYQRVDLLEDSFDIEGMLEAGRRMNRLCEQVREALRGLLPGALYLGAGGCRVCESCAYPEPCRFPEKAIPSLEAYGVAVSELAARAGMRYTNGENTVTYFGAVLFD